jgi:hypothetical protein
MRVLQKLLTTLIGFLFTMGGVGKASAQQAQSAANGTVVIARADRGPSMNGGWYESQQNRLLLLAATKDNNRNKNNNKNKTKNKTKTKSRSKTKTTKKKPKSPSK